MRFLNFSVITLWLGMAMSGAQAATGLITLQNATGAGPVTVFYRYLPRFGRRAMGVCRPGSQHRGIF